MRSLEALYFGKGKLDQILSVGKQIRNQKAKTFKTFDAEMQLTILKWLELAGGWHCLDLYQDDVRSAISYWQSMQTERNLEMAIRQRRDADTFAYFQSQ